jgi:hypothetical protein
MIEFTSIDRFEISGRGTVFTTKTPCDFQRGFPEIMGKKIKVDGRPYICRGVETYAIWVQYWKAGEPVGILVKEVE